MGVQQDDDLSKSVQKTPNRVTLDSIKAKMRIEFIHPTSLPTMTIAVVTLENGFVVLGKSAPADPANFDEKVGQTFATEDAIRQIWQLEGYLLREKLYAQP